MGSSWSKKNENYTKEVTITITGNPNVGKTILSSRIKGDKFEATVPTLGIQQFKFVRNKILVNVNDLGGNPAIMKIWDNYYTESYGIIYVIDSNDKEQFESSIFQLKNIAKHKHIIDKPILIVLNKCEVVDSLRSEDVEKLLNINDYQNMYLTKCSCSVENNDPLYKLLMKNFDNFLTEILSKYNFILHRITVDKQSSTKENGITKCNNDNDEQIIDLVPATYLRRSTLFDTVKNIDNPKEGEEISEPNDLMTEQNNIINEKTHTVEKRVTIKNTEEFEYIDHIFPNDQDCTDNNIVESEDSDF